LIELNCWFLNYHHSRVRDCSGYRPRA